MSDGSDIILRAHIKPNSFHQSVSVYCDQPPEKNLELEIKGRA